MNAVPVPTPIQRPIYRNERIRDISLWMQDNIHELEAYVAQLEAICDDGIKEDPFTLMAVQYDLELARVNREQFEEACA